MQTATPTMTPTSAPSVPFSRDPGPVRLAVVGGTTAFLCEFVGDLGCSVPDEVTWDLRLLGRDPAGIRRMTEYSNSVVRPPHRVVVTGDAARALDGANVVLVQPRVGGLAERAADEDLAAQVGAPADEGLGPGGLRAALRIAPVLRGLAREIRRRAPGALSIGFSNPLSTTVAVLAESGLPVVGTCELPGVTADEVARWLQVGPERLTWSFAGLNHRGFLHDLRIDGEPALERLLAALTAASEGVGGITRDVIDQMGAVPLKYHAMLSGASLPPSGRARQLAGIRASANTELDREPRVLPPALAGRSMPWYRQAVVPLLTALAGCGGARLVLDVRCDDGIVREIGCRVDERGVWPDGATAAPPEAVQHWVSRFETHERAVSELLARPGDETLAAALDLDPATPAAAVGTLVDRLAEPLSALQAAPVVSRWLAT